MARAVDLRSAELIVMSAERGPTVLLARLVMKRTMGQERMRYWRVEDQLFTLGDGHEIPSSFGTLVSRVAGMGWSAAGLILLVPAGALGSTVGPGRIAGIAILTPAVGCFGVMAVWFGRNLKWRWQTRNAESFCPKVYSIPEWLGLIIGLAVGLALGFSWTS